LPLVSLSGLCDCIQMSVLAGGEPERLLSSIEHVLYADTIILPHTESPQFGPRHRGNSDSDLPEF